MNCKKFLAGALSAAIAFSTMSFSAFAANTLTLDVVQDAAAAGGTVTVKLPFTDMGKSINAITIDLEYDDEAFEYVSTSYGVFTLLSNNTDNVGDNIANGKVSYSKDDMYNTSQTGDLITATFRVRSDATGGIKDFNITCAQVGNNDGTWMFDTTKADDPDTVTKDSITIQAPAPLAEPSVNIDESTKTASWGAVTHAKDYKVVLYKNGKSVYETTTTATSFDFSKKVDISAEYKVGVTALQSETLYTTSAEGAAAKTITVNSTVTPDSKAYVTGSGAINFTLGKNGNELTSVKCGTDDVTYTEANGIVTIQETAIKTGVYSFEFSYNGTVVNTVAVNITVTEAADSAVLVFAEKAKIGDYQTDDDTVYNDGSNDGLIVVTNGSQPVKGFLGAQFSINNAAEAGFDKVEYEIVPAEGYSLLYDEVLDTYEINVKPVNGKAPNVVEEDNGKGIVIGKLVRKGNSYGKGTITASSILITVEKSDNTYKTLNGTNLSFKYDIPEPTETLNVNVDFTLPTLTSNAADYQNMTVNLYSARLGNIELALGNDKTDVYTSEDGKITATLTSSDNKYALAVKGLPKFEAYTVSIKGDGYRDAKAQFVLNEETTVNFWNNANETDVPFITKASEKKFSKVNFLAGDIIMNGTIDLYDLSAVSSYYGKSGLTAEDKDYIQYDLNRDGKVDLIDITMLLAGWAN